MNYKDYLQSDHWQSIRQRTLSFYKNKCAVCLSQNNLNVHHMTYKRLGKEKIKDLVVLCRKCHQIIHFNYFNDHIKDFQRLKQRLKKMKKNYQVGKGYGLLSRIEDGIPIAHPLIQHRWENAASGKQ